MEFAGNVRLLQQQKATARTLVDGGQLRTGDMGRLDEDGNLIFINRYDNVCKCMGLNIAGDVVI